MKRHKVPPQYFMPFRVYILGQIGIFTKVLRKMNFSMTILPLKN